LFSRLLEPVGNRHHPFINAELRIVAATPSCFSPFFRARRSVTGTDDGPIAQLNLGRDELEGRGSPLH
jgi:hypothetical protein